MVIQARVSLETGIRLNVAQAGNKDGQPVLLLHGWPQTNYAWRKVIPFLVEMGYRVLAPDLRGFGASSKPEGVYSKLVVAKDFVSLGVRPLRRTA